MASIKTKFFVGLFVSIGFAVVIAAVIWLGMSHYLEKGRYMVAYFDESVQGLDKDSPVKYRGVTIGRVHHIAVAPDANLIQVVLKIEKDISLPDNVVAQLRSVGITGIMYVELDRRSESATYRSPEISFPTKYPIIATRPSDIKKLMAGINEVLLKLGELKIDALSRSAVKTLEKINQAIDDAQVAVVSQNMRASINSIQQVFNTDKWHAAIQAIRGAAEKVSTVAGEGRRTLSGIDATLKGVENILTTNEKQVEMLIDEIRTSTQNINRLLNSSDQLVHASTVELIHFLTQLNAAVKHYESAGKNLNRFLEIITAQPSQLFFSEPSLERDVDQNRR